MTAERRLTLLGVQLLLRGEPDRLDAALDELGCLLNSPAAAAQPAEAVAATVIEVSGDTGQLLAELTRVAVTTSPLLCIHAGVVSAGHGCLVIPGASGLGKTTLTAALVQAGFGYLSDEVLAVDRRDLAVTGFARPLALGPESWTLLGLDPARLPGPEQERLAALAELGSLGRPAPVREILLAERRAGPASLDRLSRGLAVPALLGRSFNHFRDPAASFRTVVELVGQAQVWRAGYQDAPELARLLASRWPPG